MGTVLITGAGRGLGLAFVHACRERGHTVIATARQPEKAEALVALDDVTVVPLDVGDAESIRALPRAVNTDRIDLLINNAGINSKGVPDAQKNVKYGTLEPEGILQMVRINACGPLLVTQALDAKLQEGSRVLNISSWLGSIGRKISGGNYGYCASKATLNMVTRALAFDLEKRGVLVVAGNPGWVQTDMGGSSAKLTAEDAVNGLLDTVEGLSTDDVGAFVQWDGDRLPW